MRQTEFFLKACDPKVLTVGQLMQDAVTRCTSRTDAATIAHLTTHRNFGSLPVVDEVVFHSLEIGGDRRQILIGPQHCFVTAFEHIGDHLVIEMAKLVLHFFVEAVETHMKVTDLAFEQETPFGEALLL